MATTESADPRPVLRVVRGNPDAADLAAIAATLALVASTGESAESAELPRTWAAYWRQVRRPLPTGPNAWRASVR